jgi:flagellar protein FliO/FliZ
MPFTPAFISLFAAVGQDGENAPLNLDGADAASQAAGSSGGGLVRTIVGLAVVIGVIYGLHWVLKQVKSAREGQASGTALDTLASLPLGGSRSVHLVRAGGEIVLLGVSEGGVTPIRSYTEAEARALGLIGESDRDGGPPAAFGQSGNWLDKLRDRTVIR